MRINIIAARHRGQNPTASREVTVEPDGKNVFLQVPETSGVMTGDSAITVGEALLEAAGFEAQSSDTIPAGWTLTAQDGGYVISDPAGVIRGNFRPVSAYVSV